MASLNKWTGLGFVGQDPTIRQTQDGKDVASFSLATTESWKDKQGQKQSKSEWHNIVVFGGQVSIVKNYIKKGSQLYIEGKLQTKKWQDKEGRDKYTTEIVLQGFNSILQMLGGKPEDKRDPAWERVEESFIDKIEEPPY